MSENHITGNWGQDFPLCGCLIGGKKLIMYTIRRKLSDIKKGRGGCV